MTATLDHETEPQIAEPADGITADRAAELYRSLEHHPEQDSWSFTGDLEEGRALVERDRYVTVTKTADGKATIVLLGDREDPTDEDHAEWGMHADEEQAWRYAIGALFGPLDEHNGGIIHQYAGAGGIPEGKALVPNDEPGPAYILVDQPQPNTIG